MDGKVGMGRGCKRGCNHGNKYRYNNKARDDPQNAEHSTKSGLGGTVPIPVEKVFLVILCQVKWIAEFLMLPTQPLSW